MDDLPPDAISPRALYLRIPPAVRVAIRTAAYADPAGPMAELHDQLLVSGRYIALSHPTLTEGMAAVQQAGHMTEAELAAVLNPVVALEEKP